MEVLSLFASGLAAQPAQPSQAASRLAGQAGLDQQLSSTRASRSRPAYTSCGLPQDLGLGLSMLATALQFGFLLFVAIGNLCLGFVMARRLGWGHSLPIALYALRSRWRAGPNGVLPLDLAESATERQSSDESAAAEPLAAPGDATPHDSSRESAEAMVVVAKENERLLDEIAAGLQQAGEAVTTSELEAAVSQINDVGQRLQQRLNSAADLYRQDGETKDNETAERLEQLWQSINDALLGLMLLSLAPEALAEPVRQVIEATETISLAGQEAADKLAAAQGGARELVVA